MKKIFFSIIISLILAFTGCKKDNSANPVASTSSSDTLTVTYAGQTYHTVQIGNQIWFQENLNIGTMIKSSQGQTNNGVIEKYCYNDDSANCTTYGGLYQWAEVVQYQNGATNTSSANSALSGNIQGICPSGWHIPTLNEFDTLENTISQDANSLKAIGQDSYSTDTSGFSALFAGDHVNGASYQELGGNTYFWSSTEDNSANAYILGMGFNESSTFTFASLKLDGFSVRCVKN
jgi:uncharacterized protein (TIGR02145 family)